MELTQRTTLFDRTRDTSNTGRNLPSRTAENRDTAAGLDADICRMLADYLEHFPANDSIIEIKGKLIRFIRSV